MTSTDADPCPAAALRNAGMLECLARAPAFEVRLPQSYRADESCGWDRSWRGCLLLAPCWALGHPISSCPWPSKSSSLPSMPSSEPPPSRKCLLCHACCSTRIHQIHSRLVSSPKTASRWLWTFPFSASTVWILDCLLLLLLLLS
jgi:hypothetical protein